MIDFVFHQSNDHWTEYLKFVKSIYINSLLPNFSIVCCSYSMCIYLIAFSQLYLVDLSDRIILYNQT